MWGERERREGERGGRRERESVCILSFHEREA
jgi:hypothetical protein